MCTLSWLSDNKGYHVYFNRDEQKHRAEECPPRLHRLSGAVFLAPVDGAGGGTWMGVTSRAIALCLLNLYPSGLSPDAGQRYVSRGRLVMDYLSMTDADQIRDDFQKRDLRAFKPFSLVMFQRTSAPELMRWDGQKASIRILDEHVLTSSSFLPAEVEPVRLETFRRMTRESGLTRETLERFHDQREPSGPFAICMQRPDAMTVSHSRVHVADSDITFVYHARPLSSGTEPQTSGLTSSHD